MRLEAMLGAIFLDAGFDAAAAAVARIMRRECRNCRPPSA